MSFATLFQASFGPETRSRGSSYQRQGRVRLLSAQREEVMARVRGASVYTVVIRRVAKVLEATCTCPAFARHGNECKHVWATLLEISAALDSKIPSRLGEGLIAFAAASLAAGANGGPSQDMDDRRRTHQRHEPGRVPTGRGVASGPTVRAPRGGGWRERLAPLLSVKSSRSPSAAPVAAVEREILWVFDLDGSNADGQVRLWMAHRDRRRNGEWGAMKRHGILVTELARPEARLDAEIYAIVRGASLHGDEIGSEFQMSGGSFWLSRQLFEVVAPRICATGRARWAPEPNDADQWSPVEWDPGGPWTVELSLEKAKRGYELKGEFVRGEERIEHSAPERIHRLGFFVRQGKLSLYGPTESFPWLVPLRNGGPIPVPRREALDLATGVLGHPQAPTLRLPHELRVSESTVRPIPCATIRREDRAWHYEATAVAVLAFDYDGALVPSDDVSARVPIAATRTLVRRDEAVETAARAAFDAAGFRRAARYTLREEWQIAAAKLERAVTTLASAGWRVEVEGKLFRSSGRLQLAVESGVDWFDLEGGISFDGQRAGLPELLLAIRRGDRTVLLADGSSGLIDDDARRRLSVFAELGVLERDHLRFRSSQATILDALLALQPDVSVDETFSRLRERLRTFDSVRAIDPPASFHGSLRPYQREALGWLDFLREFGLGGCLADDMGLGKTVVVLALLAGRRGPDVAGETKPSLVVVPRSLLWNWQAEAQRFTPHLRVLDHSGAGRGLLTPKLEHADIVLTTYGTLRRDVAQIREFVFDYVILDESQAIKNSGTDSAKAARLLRGTHRLALSGTPIENHLGELRSLVDFLNPGMFGPQGRAADANAWKSADVETREQIARMVRPIVLRRTKAQVASDLPARNEQTLFCEMETEQQRHYDELRSHYRAALLQRIDKVGLAQSRMNVLEALLRLRQVACHPGLLDPQHTISAKFDLLLPLLEEVVSENHKILVFSQFTKLLGLLRTQLDARGLTYEYLDGRTRDRAARVTRFQEDPTRQLFLISLKAGGVGLNLTAAEYVFLLDPWWNPAVEAQAIDRAHRIGQTRHVFAYRLVTRGTVEEKIVELQTAKRELAEAVIRSDAGGVGSLTREDVEALLS